MNLQKRMTGYIPFTAVLFGLAWTANATQDNNDWDSIWHKPLPMSKIVEVKQLGDLGKDLAGRKWHMIPTRYHQIYYQPTTAKNKIAEVYFLVDNLYKFLGERSPVKCKTPIKIFLVPNEYGRSRCSKTHNAMCTGDQGDALFIVTSLLHEETHLFNFAFLKNIKQGWWAGEFFCIYYQQRALWKAQENNINREIASRLPDGPRCHLSQIEKRGKQAFEEAFSVLYFFEEKYGRKASNRFRRACLEESRKTGGRPLSDSIFVNVFGKNMDRLHQEWLQFYGWTTIKQEDSSNRLDSRLKTNISYAVDKASVQNVVQAMAESAGLRYNFTKSKTQTDPLCKRWIRNIRVDKRPLHEALKKILNPLGLTYKLEEDAIVLYKK